MPFKLKTLFQVRPYIMIRNALYIGTFSVLALGLTGCESMKAAGEKITSIDVPFYGESDEVEASQEGIMMASSEGCPQVAVVEDLKNLTQFETPSAPTPGTKISSISITGMESACAVTEKTVAVDIGLRFDGQLGPQAAEWKTQSHSFAYPYFIAVTTPAGEILSKEVFAATIRYDSQELAITQQEKIRQVIPLREDTQAAGYEILVGFQLTDEELNYARMMASQPVAAEAPASEASADAMAPQAKATPVQPEVQAAPAPVVKATPVAAPSPVAKAAPVATPAPTPAPAAVVEKPAEQPVPTTTDGSMSAAPTTSEVKAETPTPSTPTTAPAETSPAATPAPMDPAASDAQAAPAPAVNPYAPPAPQMQVIKIKPDGTVEAQKNKN